MKKTGSIIFILFLLGISSFFIWKYLEKSNNHIDYRKFVEDNTTAILEVNNIENFLVVAKSNAQTDSQTETIISKTVELIKPFETKNKTKFIFFYEGASLQKIYVSALNLENYIAKENYNINENNLYFNGQFFLRLGVNGLLISKKKNSLKETPGSSFKSAINKNSDFGISFVHSNASIDYFLENNVLKQLKFNPKEATTQLSNSFDILTQIPKRNNFSVYSRKYLTQNAIGEDSLWYSWIDQNFAIIDYPNSHVVISDYQGLFHPDDLIGEWNSNIDSTDHSLFHVNQIEFKSIQLDLNDSIMSKMKYAGHSSGYIIISDKRESIKEFLLAQLTSKTITKEDLKWIPSNYKKIIHSVWSKESIPIGMFFNTNQSLLIHTDQNSIYSQIILTEEELNNNVEQSISWELSLTNRPNYLSPVLIKNKFSGQYILTENNLTISLIDKEGKKTWSKTENEAIIGNVSQIDLFGNGKTQFAYTTPHRLIIRDINGKMVQGFPYKSSSNFSSPVAPLDYDNNHNYRFLIGCEDGSIRNISEKGQLVQGWNFKKDSIKIIDAPIHFVINNKDYILIKNSSGEIKLVGRDGSDRSFASLNIAEPTIFQKGSIVSKNNFFTLKKSQIITTTLNGIKDSSSIELPLLHFINKINKNKQEFFSGTSNGKLKIISRFGITELEFPILDENVKRINPILDKNGEWKYFAISTEKELYLYDKNGILHPKFPIKCNGQFWVNQYQNNEKNTLITYSGGALHSTNFE